MTLQTSAVAEPRNEVLPGAAADTRVAVVGAGIIGVTMAWRLRQLGFAVTLLDRDEPMRGTSFGNMAGIAATEFLPISRPALWKKVPGWLLDPYGPIALRPAYAPRAAGWLLRFLAAGRPNRVEALTAAGAKLCERVYDDWETLLAETAQEARLKDKGCLSVYSSEQEYRDDRDKLAALDRHGVAHEFLGGQALRALEPAISEKFKQAVLLPGWRLVDDPFALGQSICARYLAAGGRLTQQDISEVSCDETGVTGLRYRDGSSDRFDRVVICAGAWTGRLAKRLGEPIPLETERGYHTQIMAPGISLEHAITRPSQGFVVAPAAGGIRVGGSVELGGLEAPANYGRAKVLCKRAQDILPDLKLGETSEWMGHRPALPDTIPIIGPSAKIANLYYATGHGHLGLTMAATTAALIGDLMVGAEPGLDLRPYRVDRY